MFVSGIFYVKERDEEREEERQEEREEERGGERRRREEEERGGEERRREVEGQSIRIPSAEPQVTKALYFIRTQPEQNSKRQSRQNMPNLASH